MMFHLKPQIRAGDRWKMRGDRRVAGRGNSPRKGPEWEKAQNGCSLRERERAVYHEN